MPKIQTTTFTTSNQLKTEMLAKSLYLPYTANDSVWLSNSIQALFVGEMSGGIYRVVTSAGEFDFLSVNDTTIARVWTFSELTNWFIVNVPYTEYAEQVSGANTTITWKANNVVYTATSNNPVEALATTIIQYLANGLPNGRQ